MDQSTLERLADECCLLAGSDAAIERFTAMVAEECARAVQ